MVEEKPADVQADLVDMGEPAAAVAVWFAEHPIPFVRVKVVDRSEIHLFLEDEQYSRTPLVQLLVLIGQARPDECDWENDHLRLWWD